MVLAADDLLSRRPCLSRDEIREEMQGNVCRCTGYQFIVDSIETAAAILDGREPPARTQYGEGANHGG
jgi:carbon-monoxide dehydrogenase small subunit